MTTIGLAAGGPPEDFQGWGSLIQKYGVTLAVAAVLLWFVLAKQDAKIEATSSATTRIEMSLTEHERSRQQDQAELERYYGFMTNLLRRICVNSAKSDVSREACESAR